MRRNETICNKMKGNEKGMNYHQIKKDDLLNGEGIRVTVFLSGCDHKCHNCQNPQTWNPNSGQPFDEKAEAELFAELEKDYVSGVTFSGGDPLNDANIEEVIWLCRKIKNRFPEKSIWVYTGYVLEEILEKYQKLSKEEYLKDNEVCDFIRGILLREKDIDVLVDGKFEEDKADVNYPWAGSINQRVIDIKKTMTLHEEVIETDGMIEKIYIQQIIEKPDKNIVLYEG